MAQDARIHRRLPAASPRLGALTGLLFAACGGGGGGGGSAATYSAAAGVDRTAPPLAAVSLQGTVTGGAPTWTQVSGPAVTVIGGTARPALTFVAPADPAILVFELAVRAGGVVRARDEVSIEVVDPGQVLVGALRTRVLVQGGGMGRATRADHDRDSQRLFALDSVAGAVHAYDASNPGAPSFAGTLPAPQPKPGFSPGPPVDVVAEDGVLAVVHEGLSRQVPGRVVFYDPVSLLELSSWSSGAGPRDADILPDGRAVAVACAGDLDQNAVADPRGSVTWVAVPPAGPGSIDPTLHVRQFNFAGYDLRRAELLAAGVRLSRANVDVSRDLEPSAVTFTPDGAKLIVSLPANNALAEVDVANLVISRLHGLPLADWSGAPGEVTSLAGLLPLPFVDDRPTALTTGGQSVATLDFEGVIGMTTTGVAGVHEVELVSARGPVLPAQNVDGDAELERPFALEASGPRVVRVALDEATGAFEVLSDVALRSASGPLSSRPNVRSSAPGLAGHDEAAVDLGGVALPLDPLGLHVGDAARVGGELWLADHQRPSLARFDASGLLVARYVPAGANGAGAVVGTERLPAVYAQRVLGGGFEGVASSADGAAVLAILGRPLDNPDTTDDAASRASRIVRVLALSRATAMVVGEYAYVLEAPGHVVRDLDLDTNGDLVVLEEDPSGSFCALFRAELSGATNLATLGAQYAAVSAALETTAPAGLQALPAPVTPLAKSLAADLGESGVRATAFLARGPDRELPLLVRADTHGLGAAVLDTSTRRFTTPSGADSTPTTLALFGARGRQLDASDRDEGLALASRPVQGLRQALDLVALDVDGVVLVAGADGGEARVLGGTPGYDETTTVGEVTLDTAVFPNAATLSREEELGRLRISRVDGDLDQNGLYERLLAFGGRSVFVADLEGHVVWDSGDRVDRRVDVRQPDRRARLDAAAPLAGLAPRSLAVVELGATRFLVAACAGSGSLAAFDLTVPRAPRFAGFLPSAAGADPTDLTFVPASDAPLGRPYLLVVDAAQGTLELLDVE